MEEHITRRISVHQTCHAFPTLFDIYLQSVYEATDAHFHANTVVHPR